MVVAWTQLVLATMSKPSVLLNIAIHHGGLVGNLINEVAEARSDPWKIACFGHKDQSRLTMVLAAVKLPDWVVCQT